MRAYPNELRERVLGALDKGENTRAQIAEQFKVSVSWIGKLLRQRKAVAIAQRSGGNGKSPYVGPDPNSGIARGQSRLEGQEPTGGSDKCDQALAGCEGSQVSAGHSTGAPTAGHEPVASRGSNDHDAGSVTGIPTIRRGLMADLMRPNHVRVMVQMHSTPALAAASYGPVASAPDPGFSGLGGILFDASYSPVPIPPRGTPASPGRRAVTMAAAFSAPAEPTYLVRASVHEEQMLKFLEHANKHPGVVGVYADPKIQAIGGICPTGPIGTDLDVAQLLLVEELQSRGMDATGVRVAIVDTGINLGYLKSHGKTPEFARDLSWAPLDGQPLGNMPVAHGTMCAYDVCIAAPHCTLLDLAVLTSTTMGGSQMDGLLSDAVRAYGNLLAYMSRAAEPFMGDDTPRTLVVNNSWGMFHPSWDFPVGDPQRR